MIPDTRSVRKALRQSSVHFNLGVESGTEKQTGLNLLVPNSPKANETGGGGGGGFILSPVWSVE